MYIRHAQSHFIRGDKRFVTYLEGQLEEFFLQRFDIPIQNRFNRFLLGSYFLSTFQGAMLNRHLRTETIIRRLSSKRTTLHYLSIDSWRMKNADQLMNEVETVTKIQPLWQEHFKFAKLKHDSKVGRLIDSVLKSGKVSMETAMKLAASEKLLMVYKYAEGFSEVHSSQTETQNSIRSQILELKGKKMGKARKAKLDGLKKDLEHLHSNWIRAPLVTALERKGFKKLFSKNDGLFFLPNSMIPSKYGSDHEEFIKAEVLKTAEAYMISIKDSIHLKDHPDGLSYVLFSHIIQISDLSILLSKRSLEISTPDLAHMLMTSYLTASKERVARVFMNDLVRNVDFVSMLPKNATGKYLKKNIDSLKSILWEDLKIDIYKPSRLAELTPAQVSLICDRMIALDNSVTKRRLVGLLLKQMRYYADLATELTEIMVKKD